MHILDKGEVSSNALIAPVPGENGCTNTTAFFFLQQRKKHFSFNVIAKDMKHWWEATFNCALFKSEKTPKLLNALNAEVEQERGKL